MREKIYCYECNETHAYTTESCRVESTIKGIKIVYDAVIAVCANCDEEIYIKELSDSNIEKANEAYRRAADLISVTDIEILLEQYKIGKKPLAKMLGWGENTIIRYLDGQTPSKEYSNRLKELFTPRNMKRLVELNGGKLTDVAKRRVLANLDDQMSANSFDNKVIYIAKYFQTKIDSDFGKVITQLKLQKLLYFAQAWYLAFNKKALFDDVFQAWAYGPVLSDVYTSYRTYGKECLPKESLSHIKNISMDETSFLDDIWNAYGIFDAGYLVDISHKDKPWIDVRGSRNKFERCSDSISTNEIKDYYSEIIISNEISNSKDIKEYVLNITR